jgi:hypothetical protein
LERLRDAAAAGVIDRLYVHSPDRLARRHAYQVLLIEEFRLLATFGNYSTPPHSNKLLRENGFLAYRIRPEWEATKCAIGS